MMIGVPIFSYSFDDDSLKNQIQKIDLKTFEHRTHV